MVEFSTAVTVLVIAMLWVPLVAVCTLIPVAVYIVARWRHSKEYRVPDPQLGLKAIWSFFKLVGFQIGVIGFSLFLFGISQPRNEIGAGPLGGGLFMLGALVYAIHWAAMKRTNHDQFPHTMRMFSGLNMIMVGMGAVFATIFALVVTLTPPPSMELVKMGWTFTATYLVAWIISARGFLRVHVLRWQRQSPPEA
ncbi:MAG: hypothetical protein MJE77_12480 [Proteobacteria bacterium]|nr:hypothetical protein [Pseudomonadota bacterium]